jgi:hypothetical protein
LDGLRLLVQFRKSLFKVGIRFRCQVIAASLESRITPNQPSGDRQQTQKNPPL